MVNEVSFETDGLPISFQIDSSGDLEIEIGHYGEYTLTWLNKEQQKKLLSWLSKNLDVK